MKILVIGSGGREHAIAWRLSLERHQIFGAPGNPGIAQIGPIFGTIEYLNVAESVQADLTVVGPEVPLVAGIVDQFRARGLAIVGPMQANAQLEGGILAFSPVTHAGSLEWICNPSKQLKDKWVPAICRN